MKMLTLFFLSLFLFCEISLADKPDTSAAKGVMHVFERQLSTLRPYLTSEEAFKNPKAKKEITAALEKLEKQLESQRPKVLTENVGFRINFDLLSYHVKKTKSYYDSGQLEFARNSLAATTNFCASCHAQVPVAKSGWGSLLDDSKELKKVNYENAEYLFITRRFDQSINYFDQLVRTFPDSKLPPEKLPNLYRRKLAFFARIERNPTKAVESLKKDLENKLLPMDIRQNIESWIGTFEVWKREKTSLDSLETLPLLAAIKKTMPEYEKRKIAPADTDVVNLLRQSGLLYERLLKEADSANTPETLYVLASLERKIGPLYWYSLSDIFLTECIRKYPKKPITAQCFDLYKQGLMDRYGTESGMPDDWKATLEALKSNL